MTRGRANRHLAGLAATTGLALALASRELAVAGVVVYLAAVARDAWLEANGRLDDDLAELEDNHPPPGR